MPLLIDIPVEVLLDNLFPFIPVPDLLRLASTSKFFALLCADDTLWKRRLQADFNFSGAGTARTTGWKFIYQGLSQPQVFVWGQKSHGRLGLSKFPQSTIPDVPFPAQLRIPGIRIVSLIAGGMSFHALDSQGNIYVWGTLDGSSYTLESDGFSESGKTSATPLRLQLPTATRSISCGRLHAAALDSNRHIWNFLSWGRPFRLSTPLLTTRDSVPVQIECGWGFSSVLTKSGDVFVWWPFSGEMYDRIVSRNTEMDEAGDKKALAADGVIACVTWDLEADPVLLPPLPPLPELSNTNNSDTPNEETRLIQIAAFDAHLVALTNKGHVLKFGCLDNETTVSLGHWDYLPRFSEVERVREHPTFSPPEGPGRGVEPPQTMQITHISAHFQHFIAFSTGSSSIVLMGDTSTIPESDPNIIPALQNRSVISVVLGDYHKGALTATGKLLTWGAYSSGALGLGDPALLVPRTPGGFATEGQRARASRNRWGTPPDVGVPTEVRFDHGRKPKEKFCFSASAAGWHTGALVIDLERDTSDEEDEDKSVTDTVPLPQPPYTTHGPGEMPSLPTTDIFRVGHAGRGMHHASEGSSTSHHPQQEPGIPFIGRGGGIFRVGFAGRGMNRGTFGSNSGA